MATTQVAPKTAGVSLIEMQAQMAEMLAAMQALKTGTPAEKPASVTPPALAPKPTVESRKNGKTTHVTPSAKEVSVMNHWGDSIAEARILAGKLVLTLSLPADGSVSASGKSTVHQSGAVVLSDGSKLTFSRFTKL